MHERCMYLDTHSHPDAVTLVILHSSYPLECWVGHSIAGHPSAYLPQHCKVGLLPGACFPGPHSLHGQARRTELWILEDLMQFGSPHCCP